MEGNDFVLNEICCVGRLSKDLLAKIRTSIVLKWIFLKGLFLLKFEGYEYGFYQI